MKISNMHHTLSEYEIMPSVVKTKVSTRIEIKSLGIETAFEKGHEYIIRYSSDRTAPAVYRKVDRLSFEYTW